eukprot:SAG25_NODE_11142_length_312_cov_1.291080_1_plen_64_part_01
MPGRPAGHRSAAAAACSWWCLPVYGRVTPRSSSSLPPSRVPAHMSFLNRDLSGLRARSRDSAGR